jgi:hypothetical protein
MRRCLPDNHTMSAAKPEIQNSERVLCGAAVGVRAAV